MRMNRTNENVKTRTKNGTKENGSERLYIHIHRRIPAWSYSYSFSIVLCACTRGKCYIRFGSTVAVLCVKWILSYVRFSRSEQYKKKIFQMNMCTRIRCAPLSAHSSLQLRTLIAIAFGIHTDCVSSSHLFNANVGHLPGGCFWAQFEESHSLVRISAVKSIRFQYTFLAYWWMNGSQRVRTQLQ